MTNEYDKIIIDAGGDDMIVLSGASATPAEVARRIEQLRLERAHRLNTKGTAADNDLFQRWIHGQHVYAVRSVRLHGEPLNIYVSAPSLQTVLHEEMEAGATLTELDGLSRQAMSGMLYGTFTSVVEPDGEFGSVHVCDLTAELTEGAYLMAQRNGWEVG